MKDWLIDKLPFILVGLLSGLVVILIGLLLQPPPPQPAAPSPSPTARPSTQLPDWVITASPSPAPTSSKTPRPSSQPKPSAPPSPVVNPLPQARHGHLPYAEANQQSLVPIGSYGTGSDRRVEYLDQEAAAAFKNLQDAAAAEGIGIIPISGFRTITTQQGLFERQIRRQGSAADAARLSAPAGYSEHHSGFAIDIGDRDRPETDITYDFEETPAYQWMRQNGTRFGFELSFPPNNSQGINYEPWHWRYVGSAKAAAIFSVAQTLQSP